MSPAQRIGVVLIAFLGLCAGQVGAQLPRPGDERPALGELGSPVIPGLELPPLPPLPEADAFRDGTAVRVHGFIFSGNSAVTDAELEAVTAHFAGQRLAGGDLVAVRRAVTDHYIERGYVTSGAVIPDQQVGPDGLILIQITEGRLAETVITGTRRLSDDYVRDRILLATGDHVDVFALQDALRRIQEHPAIDQLAARLRPGPAPGESVLEVRVYEASGFSGVLGFDNGLSPGVGSGRSAPILQALNLTGRGDSLRLGTDLSRGLQQFESRYSIPLRADDTTLDLHYLQTRTDVVDGPFDDLNIRAKSKSFGASLRRPFLRASGSELWLGVSLERRWSRTYLQDIPFPFEEGTDNGTARLTVLRLQQDWMRRTASDLLALRSSFNLGLDISATDLSASGANGPDGADSTFFSWLGQFQWAHRFDGALRDWEMLGRADVQLAADPLFSLEQYAIGGLSSVRGYRENLLVRDNAIVGSIELRIPVRRAVSGRPSVQLVPFFDIGHGWDHDDGQNLAPLLDLKTISSLGLGLRFTPNDRIQLGLFWGGKLRSVPTVQSDWLQDNGFHFQATLVGF